MFTGKYYAFHPGIFERRKPLIGIQVSGIENALFFVAITPFEVGKGICREMDESIHLHLYHASCSSVGTGKTGDGGATDLVE